MKTTVRHLPVFLLLSLLISCSGDDTPSRIRRVEHGLMPAVPIKGGERWSIEDRMAYYKVPGVSIAVYYDNRVVWAKGYGVMDAGTKMPVTDSTLFIAGSISKPVAVAGALRLVQEGKLTLDDNINTFLTSWNLPENDLTATQPVTLRLLASHNAGVTVHGFPGYADGQPVPTIVQILNGDPPANTAPIRVDIEPGTQWRYAGGGTTIMQLAMEDVSGMPFLRVMDEKVLGPIAMTSSSYKQSLAGERLARAASGHKADGSVIAGKRHIYPEMAAAGLWTTPTDLATFAIEISKAARGESDKVLNEEMASLMVTKHLTIGGSDDMALGFFLQNFEDDVYFGHGGQDEGFIAQVGGHREKGYGIAVMTNSDGRAGRLIGEIIRSVAKEYGWSGYLPEERVPVAVAEELLSRYVGVYKLGTDDMVTVTLTDSGLIGTPVDEQALRLYAVSDSMFVQSEQPITITFRLSPDGPAGEVVIEGRGRSTTASRMEEGEMVPRGYLNAGEHEKAMEAYVAVHRADPKDRAVDENRLNNLGYEYLQGGNIQAALTIFRVNVRLYPRSWNVYDSLGEGYMAAGETDLAIRNYERSIRLNPANENGKMMLKKLGGKVGG